MFLRQLKFLSVCWNHLFQSHLEKWLKPICVLLQGSPWPKWLTSQPSPYRQTSANESSGTLLCSYFPRAFTGPGTFGGGSLWFQVVHTSAGNLDWNRDSVISISAYSLNNPLPPAKPLLPKLPGLPKIVPPAGPMLVDTVGIISHSCHDGTMASLRTCYGLSENVGLFSSPGQ